MAEIPVRFLPDTVVVKPYAGSGAYGDTYGDPVEVSCMIDDRRKLVRAADGSEVVSESTLICRLQHAATITPGSTVDLPHRQGTVIGLSEHRDGGLGAWQHLEVTVS